MTLPSKHPWLSVAVMLPMLSACEQPSSRAADEAQVAPAEAGEAQTASPGNPPAPELAAADAVFREGRYAEAAELFRALTGTYAARGNAAGHWEAQVKLAYALGLLGHREEAETEFTKAMQLADGDASREGWTSVRKGSFYSRQGKFDLARAEATRAQELAEEAGDRKLEGTSWYLLGETYSLTGRYREAIEANERRLEIARNIGAQESDIADALSQIAIDYRHVGRHSDAAELYQEALAIHRRLDNPEGQARVLYNLANVHVSTGDHAAAVAMMRDALDRVAQTENPRAEALVLSGLAELYRRAGNRTAAAGHLARALEINRRIRQPYGEATNLLSLGWLFLDDGEVDVAEERFAAARALADEHGYGRERSGAHAGLARVAARLGEGDAALELADEAIRIADELDDPEARVEALEARAAALEAAGEENTAAWLEAIDLLESWRGRLALGDLRMSVAEPRWSIYEGAIRVLLEQSRAAEAFAVAERARARLLLEIMADRDASRAAGSETATLRRRLRESYEQRAALEEPANAMVLDREIAGLEQALAALERSAAARNAATGAARYPSPASMADVQKELLGSGRALLAFFWGERQVYGWWITANEVRAARLGPADALAARIDFLRAAIEQPSGGPPWSEPARAAFDALIAPLSPTPAEEVFVIADGPVSRIPIEVLLTADGAEPLGATARIVYGPSASVLLGLARSEEPRRWDRTILIVGNPLSADGAMPASRWRDDSLAPLPYAAEEARAIFRLFRGERAELLVGAGATLDAWIDLQPARYRYLHFAAHARVSAEKPEQTHLVLAGGHLDLAAIRELDLETELVTLSACETGRGRRVRGEGIIGLSHAFLAAGARGAVVTLWRIDDATAAEFMQRFYRRLHDGTPPAEALLAVRREQIAAAGSDPAHWAPFVLVGGL